MTVGWKNTGYSLHFHLKRSVVSCKCFGGMEVGRATTTMENRRVRRTSRVLSLVITDAPVSKYARAKHQLRALAVSLVLAILASTVSALVAAASLLLFTHGGNNCGQTFLGTSINIFLYISWLTTYFSILGSTTIGSAFNESYQLAKYHYVVASLVLFIVVACITPMREYGNLEKCLISVLVVLCTFFCPALTYRVHRAYLKSKTTTSWKRYLVVGLLNHFITSFIATACALSSGSYIVVDNKFTNSFLETLAINGVAYPVACVLIRWLFKNMLSAQRRRILNIISTCL